MKNLVFLFVTLFLSFVSCTNSNNKTEEVTLKTELTSVEEKKDTILDKIIVRHVVSKIDDSIVEEFYEIDEVYLTTEVTKLTNGLFRVNLPDYNEGRFNFETRFQIVQIGDSTLKTEEPSSGAIDFKTEGEVVRYFNDRGYKLSSSIPKKYYTTMVFIK